MLFTQQPLSAIPHSPTATMFNPTTTGTSPSAATHPFYPVSIELAGYLANDKDSCTLLGIALAGLATICSATWALASRISPRLRTMDKLAVLWFMSSEAHDP
jgi:cholestenol delta-isomerase